MSGRCNRCGDPHVCQGPPVAGGVRVLLFDPAGRLISDVLTEVGIAHMWDWSMMVGGIALVRPGEPIPKFRVPGSGDDPAVT